MTERLDKLFFYSVRNTDKCGKKSFDACDIRFYNNKDTNNEKTHDKKGIHHGTFFSLYADGEPVHFS